ncbi:Dennd4b [Symbiodinium pilosum]|uniref:Dennd4b protein n=1 Tax=Symbiodinium pilosum TaxID=2952 RepID=A0A812PB81_SYMPI|nr:Dennd4b [Symbiodinium pilosum]
MDGGHSTPENAVRYFAVIGVHDEAALPEAGELPVQVLQRYPKKDHKDVRFPPALASFCFPRGGAQVAGPQDEVVETLHGFVLTNEAGDRCFGAALHIWCWDAARSCLVQRAGALAVVSTQPLWGAFRAFLYSLRYSGNSPERFVVSFISETPLPPPGFQVIVPWPEIPPFALQRPAPNQLPLLDLPVRQADSCCKARQAEPCQVDFPAAQARKCCHNRRGIASRASNRSSFSLLRALLQLLGCA